MKLYFFILFFVFQLNAISQGKFEIGVSHAFPLGEMSIIYKSTLGAQGIRWFDVNENRRMGYGFGFHVFKPKEKVFYYHLYPNNFGTVGYSRFWSFPMFYAFEKILKSKRGNIIPFIGLNLGLNLVYFGSSKGGSVLYPDFSGGWGDNTLETLLAIDPKFGISTPLQKGELTFYIRLNFSISAIGGNEAFYNTNNGRIFPTWNYGLRYKFGK